MHFGAVLLAWLDSLHELHQPRMLAVTVGGFLHISLVGLTAGARADQTARRWLNRVGFYLAWVFFVLATGVGAPTQPASAVLLAGVAGAMAIRGAAGMAARKRRAVAPSV